MDIGEIIRQRIAKLKKLEELASDPEMADMMKEIGRAVAMEGAGVPASTPHEPDVPHAKPPITAPIRSLGPKAAVRSTLHAFVGKQFTHNDVLAELRSKGYVFNAKNAPVTVSGILKRLVHPDGELKKIEGKIGPNGATIYEVPVTFVGASGD
jgi:hypothetical protein